MPESVVGTPRLVLQGPIDYCFWALKRVVTVSKGGLPSWPKESLWISDWDTDDLTSRAPELWAGRAGHLGAETQYQALFLASTVSALHTNAHIWNASHPLLVTYYCWVTVYSHSMEAKKSSQKLCRLRESNQGLLGLQSTCRSFVLFGQSYPMGHTVNMKNANLFKPLITTFAENRKYQLMPKITNHLFTCYLNCMCKSNPVCLIQQWLVIFLLAPYVQWLWNRPIDFYTRLCSPWKGMQLSVLLHEMNE